MTWTRSPEGKREFDVLYHLSRVGFIQKSDLSLFKGQKDDRQHQRAIKKAVENGYIGTIAYSRSDCCFLTEAGSKRLCNLAKNLSDIGIDIHHNKVMDEFAEFYGTNKADEGWQPTERLSPEPMTWKTANARERLGEGEYNKYFRQNLRRGGTLNIMLSADVIVYKEDKPDFDTFVRILSNLNLKETFLWKLIVEHGIYYTAEEIRSESRKMQSRFTGMLFTVHGNYVVYNMMERISKWTPTTEQESKANFLEAKDEMIPYMGMPAASIVLTKGKAMVTTMVSGYKSGVKKVKKPGFVEKKLKKKNDRYMNITNMRAAIFEKIYLVETNSRGMESLWWFIHTTPEEAAEEYENLAKENPTKFEWVETYGGKRMLYEKETGQQVLIQHIYDLTKLQALRNTEEEILVFGYDWQATATSMALAHSFGKFVSIETGDLVKTPKYNSDRKIIE